MEQTYSSLLSGACSDGSVEIHDEMGGNHDNVGRGKDMNNETKSANGDKKECEDGNSIVGNNSDEELNRTMMIKIQPFWQL